MGGGWGCRTIWQIAQPRSRLRSQACEQMPAFPSAAAHSVLLTCGSAQLRVLQPSQSPWFISSEFGGPDSLTCLVVQQTRIFLSWLYVSYLLCYNGEAFSSYHWNVFPAGYDMSTFIRRYGRYLNEKAFAYRQMAFDFTRVKKG